MKNKTIFTRKLGIWIMIVGLLIAFPINIFLIEFVNESIDVDIFGVLIFIIGLVIMIVRWKKR